MEFKPNWDFILPETNLHFGKGTLGRLGEVAAKYGKKALLVTGKSSMHRLGFLEKAKDGLEAAGVEVTLLEGVEPNPSTETVDKGINLGEGSDFVVAIGGGSSIDAAKGMAIGIGHKAKHIWPFVIGEKPITPKTVPIIAIPSTSGTGSHLTWYSVITNRETGEKAAFSSKFIFPRESFVDLDIVSKMSREVTAETGFDALAHVMESYVSRKSSPVTDILCLKAIGLIGKSLPKAYEDGSDMEARYNMALADSYAGICITPSRTILVHAMGNVVSGVYPQVAHGRALAALTGPVMKYNIERGDRATVGRYCDIAIALGAGFSKGGPSLREKALKAVELVEVLRHKIGVDKSLGEMGAKEEDIERLTQLALRFGAGAIACNPIEPTRQDITDLFKEAM